MYKYMGQQTIFLNLSHRRATKAHERVLHTHSPEPSVLRACQYNYTALSVELIAQ